MIMGYKRIFIGLVIAAIIAIGAYAGVLIARNGQHRKAVEEEKKKVVYSFDPMDITGFNVTNSSGDYMMKLTNSGWEFIKGEAFNLSADRIVETATAMSELTASRILTEELPDRLSDYGLDKPMKVGFTFKDGTVRTLDIGSKVPGDAAYYAKDEDRDTIYIVSEDDYQKLSAELSDLKEKFLFNISSTGDINKLKYVDHGNVIYDIARDENGVFRLASPFPQGEVNEALVTNITSLIIRAQCVTFIDEDLTDLSKFGFDTPSYQIEISSDKLSTNVIFGNFYDEAQQYIYAYDKSIDQIYIFDKASLGFIGTKTEDILYKRLHYEDFDNIKEFRMNVLGTEINIEYNYNVGNGLETSYTLNGKTVNREDEDILMTFNNLINAVTGLSFDNICEDDHFNTLSKEPAVKITYKLKEGDDYVVELYAMKDDPEQLQIVENGKYAESTVSKKVIENGMLLYYKELMEKMK